MPVGRTEDQDDGRPLRSYRGKPQPLGLLTEWQCPSCGEKVSGQVYEAGCPHCGVNTPGNTPPIREPQPLTEDHPGLQSHAPRVGVTPATASAGKPGDLRSSAPAYVVTRIIQYICTDPAQQANMELTLQRALVGRTGFAWGEIIAAIVDDISPRQQDILSLAKRQPGVWLGGPDMNDRYPLQVLHVPSPGPAPATVWYEEAPGREEAHPGKPFIGSTGMDMPEMPSTGPEFSRMDAEMARVLLQACGVRVAYTFALALQSLAAASDDSDPLVLPAVECYALANAIMQLIPAEYVDPQLPPPPPPNETLRPSVPDDVQQRIKAIQAASKPEASFRE